MNFAEKIEKVHEELIEQEGVELSSLPEIIRKKIKGWNLLYARLNKQPEDEKLYRSLQKTSIQLADKIQDFLENDYEDEKPAKEVSESDEKPAKEVSELDEKPAKEVSESDEKPAKEVSESDEKPAKEVKSSFGNIVMQKKIEQAINENGNSRIRVSQLRDIIGREPDYPEQIVNKIKLRKVFMSSEYRIV